MSAKRFMKLSEFLLSLPKLLLSLGKAIVKLVTKALSKAILLPLNTVSGKLLVVTVILLAINVVGALLYVLGTWQTVDQWVSWGTTILRYGLVAIVIPGTLFLIAYPLDRLGLIEEAIVKSGVRQRNRMSSGLLAALFGFLTALVVALATGYLYAFAIGGDLAFAALNRRVLGVAFVVSFLVGTLLLFYTFQKTNKSHIRTDLSIITVKKADNGERTVVIRNDSDSSLDLWEAKFEDSAGDYYRLNVHPRLRPGEKGTFDLPAEFDLETVDDVPRGIGPFYGGKKVTSIYARQGDTYVLEWHDVVEEPALT